MYCYSESIVSKCKVIMQLLGLALLAPTLSHATCWAEAGARHGVDPLLLKAIAWQESRGWPHALGPKLPDGNQAIGLMQINSVHLPALAKFGIGRNDLLDACVSQFVGAWILADCTSRYGATWRAVGCYYAGPASRNLPAQLAYVRDVQRHYAGYLRQAQQAQQPAPPAQAYAEATSQ